MVILMIMAIVMVMVTMVAVVTMVFPVFLVLVVSRVVVVVVIVVAVVTLISFVAFLLLLLFQVFFHLRVCALQEGEDGAKKEKTDGNQDLLTSIIAVCGLNFFDKILSKFLSSLQLADAKN